MRFQAVGFLNAVTERLLVRPLGIFQLIDFVGLDVFAMICSVMRHNLGEAFGSDRLNVMLSRGVVGGQNPDGSQKNGFFRYEEGQVVGVYCLAKGDYEELGSECAAIPLLEGHVTWREAIQGDSVWTKAYFARLCASDTRASRVAWKYLQRSREIAARLVIDGVAEKPEDVDTVLKLGFYHAYGLLESVPVGGEVLR